MVGTIPLLLPMLPRCCCSCCFCLGEGGGCCKCDVMCDMCEPMGCKCDVAPPSSPGPGVGGMGLLLRRQALSLNRPGALLLLLLRPLCIAPGCKDWNGREPAS